MSNAGRPTDLTDDTILEIRKLVLRGKSYKEIQEILSIPAGTWDNWHWQNYKDLRTNLQNWKREVLISKAEKNLDALLEGEDDRIRADLTKFTLERLNKKEYSSKSEVENSGSIEYIIKEGDEIQGEER